MRTRVRMMIMQGKMGEVTRTRFEKVFRLPTKIVSPSTK